MLKLFFGVRQDITIEGRPQPMGRGHELHKRSNSHMHFRLLSQEKIFVVKNNG